MINRFSTTSTSSVSNRNAILITPNKYVLEYNYIARANTSTIFSKTIKVPNGLTLKLQDTSVVTII